MDEKLSDDSDRVIENLKAENEMLRQEVRVAREAAELTSHLVIKQFEKTDKILQHLEVANAQRQAILDAVSQMSIIATDANGQILFFNRGAENLLGYRETEVVKLQTPLKFHVESEIAAYGQHLTAKLGYSITGLQVFFASAKHGFADHQEWTYIRKDGTWFPVEMSITPMRDPEGNLSGFLCAAVDVTERKKAEEALRVSETRHRTLVENIPIGIYRIRPRPSRFVMVNTAFLRMFEFESDTELQTIHLTALYADISTRDAFINKLLTQGSVKGFELQLKKKDGTIFWASVTVRAMYDKPGVESTVYFDGTLHDITERKRAEHALNQKNNYLAALHETTLGLMSRLDLNDLLEALVRRAAQMLDAPHGFIFLAENFNNIDDNFEPTGLRCRVGVGIFHQMIGYKIKMGEGLAGKVWQMGRPLVVDNYDTWSGRLPDFPYNQTRGMVEVPLKSGLQVLGVLGIAYAAKSRQRFANEEVELISRFAELASITIDNARLFEAEQRQRQIAESLHQVTAVLNSSLDRDTVLNEIMKQLDCVIQCDSAAIFLVDQQDKLVISSGLNLRDINVGHEVLVTSQDPVARVFRNKAPLILEDVHTDSYWRIFGEGQRIRAWMGVPLLTSDQSIGVLTTDNFAVGAFSLQDAQILQTFANQAAIAIENARLFTAAQQELTERKRAEAALQKANEELTKLNADKDKFFSIVAHDLKGPFMPLLGTSELMVEMAELLQPAEVKELSRSLNRSANNVHQLLENLLNWARMQMGRMKYKPLPLTLNQIVETNLKLLTEMADKKKITLQNNVDSTVQVYADQNMVDTVVRNLISNALKFTPMGGRVTVSAVFQAESVQVAVEDTGVGMSEGQLAKLFKMDTHYSSLGTDQEKGTGLGLMMCKEMVEINQGELWVVSQLREGTTVYFTLPQSIDSVTKPTL